MITQAVAGLAGPAFALIDELFTSDEGREQKKYEFLQLQQSGKLKVMEQKMSVLLAEANSPDPWTSRARPSFLYVFYILLLMGIPMGIYPSLTQRQPRPWVRALRHGWKRSQRKHRPRSGYVSLATQVLGLLRNQEVWQNNRGAWGVRS